MAPYNNKASCWPEEAEQHAIKDEAFKFDYSRPPGSDHNQYPGTVIGLLSSEELQAYLCLICGLTTYGCKKAGERTPWGLRDVSKEAGAIKLDRSFKTELVQMVLEVWGLKVRQRSAFRLFG